MTDTPRLPANFAGSISEGTLNARHLVPRYAEVLAYCWPTHELVERYRVLGAALQVVAEFTRDEPRDVADLLGVWECESMGYLLEGLFDALCEVAPEGTYFGASEGDGASFGFWPIDDEDEDEPDEAHMEGG